MIRFHTVPHIWAIKFIFIQNIKTKPKTKALRLNKYLHFTWVYYRQRFVRIFVTVNLICFSTLDLKYWGLDFLIKIKLMFEDMNKLLPSLSIKLKRRSNYYFGTEISTLGNIYTYQHNRTVYHIYLCTIKFQTIMFQLSGLNCFRCTIGMIFFY